MNLHSSRVYVWKLSTGALWSTSSLASGVWRKEDLGIKLHNTQRVGYVTTQFNPFSERNLKRFALVQPS